MGESRGELTLLSRREIEEALDCWVRAWNDHCLDGVMSLFHDQVVFENWAGVRVSGKGMLRRAWQGWFANHNGFCFTTEELFIDEVNQKALLRWELAWPARNHVIVISKRCGVGWMCCIFGMARLSPSWPTPRRLSRSMDKRSSSAWAETREWDRVDRFVSHHGNAMRFCLPDL